MTSAGGPSTTATKSGASRGVQADLLAGSSPFRKRTVRYDAGSSGCGRALPDHSLVAAAQQARERIYGCPTNTVPPGPRRYASQPRDRATTFFRPSNTSLDTTHGHTYGARCFRSRSTYTGAIAGHFPKKRMKIVLAVLAGHGCSVLDERTLTPRPPHSWNGASGPIASVPSVWPCTRNKERLHTLPGRTQLLPSTFVVVLGRALREGVQSQRGFVRAGKACTRPQPTPEPIWETAGPPAAPPTQC